MMVMNLLTKNDMYGYEITDELDRLSEGIIKIGPGTLYPLLHSLQKKDYVVTYDRNMDGRVRKYYRITPKGRHALTVRISDWQSFISLVNQVMSSTTYWGE